jgi:sugar (pentulose or hexulose) kinase
MERELHCEQVESEMEEVTRACVTREREIEYKSQEAERVRKENEKIKRTIVQTRSFIEG